MKLYIAGPMRNYALLNHPAFEAAAAQLRALGHEVVSPVELCEHLGTDRHPHVYMKLNIKAVTECDGIVLLHWWYQSTGAKAEAAVALVCGLNFYEIRDGALCQYSKPNSIFVEGYN